MSEVKLIKNAIGLREGLMQGVAGAAPAGDAVATLTGAASFALGALPLTALIAFFVVMLNGYIISRISLKVSGAGGYYEYVKNGYGPSIGLLTGLIYIFYQIMAIAFMALSIGVFIPATLSYVFNINIPIIFTTPLIIVALAYGFIISIAGIKISTRYTMVMAIVEILTVTIMGLYIILSHPSLNNIDVFTLKYSSSGITGVVMGVLLMYTAFAGFGASTPLGEESRQPKQIISKSIIALILILGVFFVFSAYVFTVAYGPDKMSGYAQSLVPGITIIGGYMVIGAAVVITILFINSLLTGLVVMVNGTSRVLMTMGRDAVLPSKLSEVHKKFKTPFLSAAAVTLTATLIAIAGNFLLGGFTAFLMTAIGATLGTLFVHIIINSSYPSINKRFNGNYDFKSLLLSLISIIIFIFILGSTFVSISQPVIIGSLAFVIWTLVSLGIIYKKKGKLKEIKIERNIEMRTETTTK